MYFSPFPPGEFQFILHEAEFIRISFVMFLGGIN